MIFLPKGFVSLKLRQIYFSKDHIGSQFSSWLFPFFNIIFHYLVLNTLFRRHISKGQLHHSHEKRKDSLEGGMIQVLFAAELVISKIPVPRLPQNTSNVNIKSAGKSKQVCYLCDQLLGAPIYLHFIVLILICF